MTRRDHAGMNKLDARRAWVREIVANHCAGKLSDFARAIGKDSSYVSRMLSPKGTKGAKGIGEDMMAAIMAAFPADTPPPEAGFLPPPAPSAPPRPAGIFSRERRTSDDQLAIQIGLESLVVALLGKTPGAASAFLADVQEVAKGHRFSTDAGFLGQLVGIAQQVQSEEEAAAQVQRRGGSVRRTKRGN